MVWIKLQEPNPDLVQDIALAAFRNLLKFRGDCKFSTFVHSIARNKIKELIRNRTRWRKVFEQTDSVQNEVEEEDRKLDELKPAELWTRIEQEQASFHVPIILDGLCEGLSADDGLLLQCKYDHMSSAEIAGLLEINTEAVDSRWARLRPKIQEKYLRTADGTDDIEATN